MHNLAAKALKLVWSLVIQLLIQAFLLNMIQPNPIHSVAYRAGVKVRAQLVQRNGTE